MSFFMFTSYH